jgi:hypothetical protein
MKSIQQMMYKFFIGACIALFGLGLANAGVGSSGTGRTSFGEITEFGSIFVNGIEYSTSSANIIINGIAGRPESELRLGMAVRVEGSINSDGKTGVANTVEFSGDIEATVDAAPVITGSRGTFTMYGIVIKTDSKTKYDNVSGLAALAAGNAVEVSGFFNGNDGSFSATRIEKQPAFRKVELRGYTSNVTATTFKLGPSLIVNYSAAQLKDIPPGGLVNGLYVEVKSTTPATNNTLQATRVSVESSILASANIAFGLVKGITANVSTSGAASAVQAKAAGDSSFVMGNQLIVTNAQTVFTGAPLNALVNGVKALASGPVINGIMTAETVDIVLPGTATWSADISGDGKSDLLLRDSTNGQISAWLMNGSSATATNGLVGPGNWTVSNVADFNDDGKADILYRNDDGSHTMWLMNGLAVSSSAGLLGANPNWRVSHVADFNGDRKADILWRNTNGAVTLWLMNGTTITSAIGLLGPDPDWSVSHLGDFNGDGKADILWRHTNGSVTLWLMNGTTVTSATSLLGADPNWGVTHVGDFNGDGKTDILWRNINGSVTQWIMFGASIANATSLLGPDPRWSVSHVGDFNGDGKADILWRSNTGAVTQWLMFGTNVANSTALLGPDPNWRVTHLGDYNGDGKADIVWRNFSDGSVTMWLMNGFATVSAAGILGPSP